METRVGRQKLPINRVPDKNGAWWIYEKVFGLGGNELFKIAR
jgi:hypothetical protein